MALSLAARGTAPPTDPLPPSATAFSINLPSPTPATHPPSPIPSAVTVDTSTLTYPENGHIVGEPIAVGVADYGQVRWLYAGPACAEGGAYILPPRNDGNEWPPQGAIARLHGTAQDQIVIASEDQAPDGTLTQKQSERR